MFKKEKYKISIIILLVILGIICLNRLETIHNEIVIKILSEDTYFNLKKHIAPKEVIKKYKKIKNENLEPVSFAFETANSLLYYYGKNGVIKEIKFENDIVSVNNYSVEFSFYVDRNYFDFIFSDKLLPFINEIEVQLYIGEKPIGWGLIAVSTNDSLFETTIHWKTLEEYSFNPEDISFKILSCRNTKVNTYHLK